MRKIYPNEINYTYLKNNKIAVYVTSERDFRIFLKLMNEKEGFGLVYQGAFNTYGIYRDGSLCYSIKRAWEENGYEVRELSFANICSNLNL